MTATTCPEDDTLARMLGEELPAEQAGAVEAHVGGCARCQAALDRLTETARGSGLEATATLTTGPDSEADPTTDLVAPNAPRPDGAARPEVAGYLIERELGRGGMGVVYLAHQVGANRPVALKLVVPSAAEKPEDLLRFRLEGESLARLHHPNIVQVHEVGAAGDRPFFSMEYVSGGTLGSCLAGGAKPPSSVAEMAETLARAVHAAHQRGIVHRDLKPANILLTDAPTGTWPGVPKVVDFGLAKHVEADSGLTRTGQIMGTPAYMAPEQARGEDAGIPADVYALGAILYEMLAGRPPFRAATPWDTLMQVVHDPPVPPSKVRPGVPVDLETIALKCLGKEPGGRYASADALAEDLRRYRDGRPIAARPAGAARRLAMWCRRHPGQAALTALTAAAVLVGAVGVGLGWARARIALDLANKAQERATHNATLARKAVEDYLTRVGENRLIREPGLQALRKELLGAALAYYREFAEEAQADPSARLDLAEAHLRMAGIAGEIASVEESKENYRIALEMSRRGGPPARPEVRRRLLLAESLRGLGQAYNLNRERDQAAPPLGEAIDGFQSLVDDRLGGDEAVEGLSRALSDLASLKKDAGDAAEAERLLRREIQLVSGREGLAFRRRLAQAYRGLGTALKGISGRAPDALQALREGVRIDRERMAAAPGDPWVADDLAGALDQLAGLAIGRGEHAESRDWATEALAAIGPAAEANPRVASFAYTRALSEYMMAWSLSTLGRYRQARDHEMSCARTMARLVEENPTEPRYRTPGLAGAYLEIGYISRLMGEWAASLDGFDRSMAVQEAAVRKAPDDLMTNVNLAMVHRYRAVARSESGDPKAGIADAERAEAILLPLTKKKPGVYPCEFELSQARLALADGLRRDGRPEAARDAYRDADAVLAPLLARDAEDVEVRAHRVTCHARRAALLANAGREAEARPLWLEGLKLAEVPGRVAPVLLHARGVLHAVGVGIGSPGDDEARAAVQCLEQAAAAGFRSAAAIEADPDLAPLRTRDDYRALVAELRRDL